MAAPLGDGFSSTGSCGQSVALTTNATTTLATPSRMIYISTDGTFNYLLAFMTASETITVYGGAVLPFRVKEVYACPASTRAYW